MESNKGSGPDMIKMLHMMLPYMDPSTKRMMSIMFKLHELKELMEPERPRAERAAQPQTGGDRHEDDSAVRQPAESDSRTASMDDENRGAKNDNLAAQLQEGLTPEQKSMITSLTGMLG